MRPIDADALLKKVEKIQPWEPYLGKYAQGIRHCMEIVSLLIKDAPTIESSAQQDIDKQELVRTITAGIVATNTKDVYSCGMRNGMRWCMALLEEDAPKFEDASLYAQPERPSGEWITDDLSGLIHCSKCGNSAPMETTGGGQYKSNFCPTCGADMINGIKSMERQ